MWRQAVDQSRTPLLFVPGLHFSGRSPVFDVHLVLFAEPGSDPERERGTSPANVIYHSVKRS